MYTSQLRSLCMLPLWRVRVEESKKQRIYWEWCAKDGTKSEGKRVEGGSWRLFCDMFVPYPIMRYDMSGFENNAAWEKLAEQLDVPLPIVVEEYVMSDRGEHSDSCHVCGKAANQDAFGFQRDMEGKGVNLCGKCAIEYQGQWRLEHARLVPDVERFVREKEISSKAELAK